MRDQVSARVPARPVQPSRETPFAPRAIARILRRHWALVAICVVVVPGVALARALSAPDVYTASAALLFRDPGFDEQVFGNTNRSDFEDPVRAAATNLELVTLREVASRAATALGPRYDADEIAEVTEASTPGDSDVMSVKASSEDPEEAARIANTVAEEFIAFRREADRAQIQEARELVLEQLDALPESVRDRREQLGQRAEDLDVLASLQTGNAELVQRATPPESPTSPRPRRDTAFGLAFGLLLGVAVALFAERLDRRVHDVDELASLLDRPILARFAEEKDGVVYRPPHEVEAQRLLEPARMLRMSLRYYNTTRTIKSVAVVSAMQEEGKTSVAWRLAAAAVSMGERVLLVEADLRRPVLARRLQLPEQAGLSDVLGVGASAADLVVQVPLDPEAGGERCVEVLLAGRTPPNPADLLESPEMDQLLQTGESIYDLIVVDAPPITAVADAIPLLRKVSGVLVVSRLGLTRRDYVRRLSDQLDNLGVLVLGVVANGVRDDDGEYGQGYV
jgi:polysaccharide biosynthesis transport protein